MFVDKKSPVPVYFQLRNSIHQRIRDGVYPEGTLIPSERDLSESLGISRMTVRQALNLLVSEGILYREKGKGTFVSREKIVQRNVMSFSETVRSRGLIPSTIVLAFEKLGNGSAFNELLALPEHEAVYKVKRLRLASEMPIAVEEVFLPERYCPQLENFDLNSSLYKLLRDAYQLAVAYMDNEIEASKPSKEERKWLNLSENIPVLRIASISYNDAGAKLFYEKAVYRADEYRYNARIYMNTK